MSKHAGAVSELVEQLGRLPGVGRKSAERLAFHLLRVSEQEALALADSIRRVRKDVRYCATCFNLSESETCAICADHSRDSTRLCVVEQPRDLMSLEQAAVFKGALSRLAGENRAAGRDRSGPADDRRPGRARSDRKFCRNHYGDQPDRRGRWDVAVYQQSFERISGRNHPSCQRNHRRKCAGICESRDDCRCPNGPTKTIIGTGFAQSRFPCGMIPSGATRHERMLLFNENLSCGCRWAFRPDSCKLKSWHRG